MATSGNFITGREAFVLYDGAEYPYSSWSAVIDKTRIDVTNFKSPGDWREKLSGFKDGTITVDGPIDIDLPLPILSDEPITLVTGIAEGCFISWPCIAVKANPKSSVEDAARSSDEFVVTGLPTFTGLEAP